MAMFEIDGAACSGHSSLSRFTMVAMIVSCLIGCGSQDAPPKTSHFEHDHLVASHWPNDLADAATKIRERLIWIETGEVPEHHAHDDHEHDDHHHDHKQDPKTEIFDLVSWVPEVAADTNLSEADWLPLHHASQSLTTNLRAAQNGLSRDDRSQIKSLCQLIDVAVQKVPEKLASLKVTSP